MNTWFIGVDIGGTQLRAACYPAEGFEPVVQRSAPTHAADGIPSLQRLLDLLAGIWPAEGTVQKVGVAVAGPVNPQTGVVYRSPNIPGWECLPLADHIRDRFGVPVELGNDANLAALGEWKYGAGVGHHNLLYLTISTGIGGGVILDDRLITGGRGIAAEVGHITVLPNGPLCGCGQRGHLEAVASGTAIANFVREQLALGRASTLAGLAEPVTARTVAEAARAGDALAGEAYERAGTFLGRGIADFLHLYDPTIVVCGGGVTKAGDLLFKPLRRALEASVMSPQYLEGLEITTAQLGERVGLIGALALARS
ncbi:MAG TPA: ROK family protein [Anaerolineaceae bacterium]|nr:ROK family protein [Anaerolineaceae bacterium]